MLTIETVNIFAFFGATKETADLELFLERNRSEDLLLVQLSPRPVASLASYLTGCKLSKVTAQVDTYSWPESVVLLIVVLT